MKKLNFAILCCLPVAACCFSTAAAFEHRFGQNTFRLNAMGSAVAGDLSDYVIRMQLNRLLSNRWNIGAVYSYDWQAYDRRKFAKDAFIYLETGLGRIEAGWTESIASKLALTLPDVGGTRLNNAPAFLPDEFVGITNPTVRGNQYAWRLNVVTLPTNPWQFGIGRTAGHADGFNNSTDIGIRYRNPNGRTKTSISLGFSYIERPLGMMADNYLPLTSARARYQATAGFNLQYGGLIWAITTKAVLDNHPIKDISDGLQAGTGLSYDFLSWSASAGYIFSAIGIWRDMRDTTAHTGIFSLRYKINKYIDIWKSTGLVDMEHATKFFIALGIGVKF
ncbi:MAG: hypothetical protein LBD94_02185 [Rickettsiales bacterium]|jgi:hypothetical protein|nr:hypothetical protein [Rickettsiales bacterium]